MIDQDVNELKCYLDEAMDDCPVNDSDKRVLALLDLVERELLDYSIKDIARSEFSDSKICVIFDNMDAIQFSETEQGLDLDFVEMSEV
jgi:hypothetical protein